MLRSVSLMSAVAFALIGAAPHLAAQIKPGVEVSFHELSFEFADHDGTSRPCDALPVMRTGDFLSKFSLTAGASQVSESMLYAWAYYYDGEILNQPDNEYFRWIFGPLGAVPDKLVADASGTYLVDLPMGTPDYPDLPAAPLKLKLWLGLPGTFQFDGHSEPTGVLVEHTYEVGVVETPFAIWLENPRNNTTGAHLSAAILTALPVDKDTYFEVKGEGTANASVEMVMIEAGATYSTPFTADLSEFRGPGRILATRIDDGASVTSSEIETGTARFEQACDGCPTSGETQPEVHLYYIWWEFCKTHGTPGGFGGGSKEECGDCAATPTVPSICNHGPTDRFCIDQNQPDCDEVTPWWDCEVFRRWVPAAEYKVEGSITTTRDGCAQGSTSGSTSTSGSSTTTLTGTVNTPGNGTIGASQQWQSSNAASTQTNMATANAKKCCKIVYAGQGHTYITDCRDVD